VTDRRDQRRRQVEKNEYPGSPKVFEDRSEAPQHEHIDGQVPELIVGKGSGDESPQMTVQNMRRADKKVGGHEIEQTRHHGACLPREKYEDVETDDN
jgi:hypothetical protein